MSLISTAAKQYVTTLVRLPTLLKPFSVVSRALVFVTFLLLPSLTLGAPAMDAPPTRQEVQKILTGDGQPQEFFGMAVAIDADTALIGAPAHRDDGIMKGSAYVYTRDARGVWSRQAELLASDAAEFAQFGRAVAISGDTAVIGASDDDDRGSFTGSAFVYTRAANGVWSEQAKLLASDGGSDDFFGYSVAVSGDTIAIGAVGAAYIFARDAAGVWSERAKLWPSNVPLSSGGIPLGVAISGDTLLTSGYLNGNAYTFTRNANGRWSEAILRASNWASFWNAVAISGDTAVVGSQSDEAYVFTRDARGVWNEQSEFRPGDGSGNVRFPAVAVSGDTIVIGGTGGTQGGARTGAAHVYTRDTNGRWSRHAKLLASDGAWFDGGGRSVAVSGDTAVIGVPFDDNTLFGGGIGSGSAYVYRVDHDPVLARLQCPGDINGDGTDELALVTGDGRVQVKDSAGAWIIGFGTGSEHSTNIDTALMPDTNTNGAPELIVLNRTMGTAGVRDLLTGAQLGTVPFGAPLAPVDLQVLADQTGDGIPDVAGLVPRLGRQRMSVEVRDARTGSLVNDVEFFTYLTGDDLATYPDRNGNGSPELAVLAEHRLNEKGSDKIAIRDAATGNVVQEIWLGKGWRVLEQETIGDLNGNGSEEAAVLRLDDPGNIDVQIRDTVTRAWVNVVGFDAEYLPRAFLAISDVNGNGADELVLFGRRYDGVNQKAVVKDSRTGERLRQVWFDRRFLPQDFVACGDLNGNGAADLALVEQRPTDGLIRVTIKDSRTAARTAVVWF